MALFPRVLDSQNTQLPVVESNAPQHEPVALQRLDGVNAHTAHHFLNLVLPRGDKVHKALIADVRVEALHKVGALGCDAPVALAGLAASAQMAAERQKCRRADVARICTERDGLDNIGAGANGAADDERNLVADALIAQALIDEAGMPLAAPSANISGHPSPTTGQHVIDDLNGKVDMILVGPDCKTGIESTIVDLCGEYPVVVRPGTVTRDQLQEVIPKKVLEVPREDSL